MSAVYDLVVKALAEAATSQAASRKIIVNPDDFEALKTELGHADQLENKHGVPHGSLWTPGSWLLRVPIFAEAWVPAGSVVLEERNHRWFT